MRPSMHISAENQLWKLTSAANSNPGIFPGSCARFCIAKVPGLQASRRAMGPVKGFELLVTSGN